MSEQYVATDKKTGVEVAVTGEFPPHPDDRVRIARTVTLFTRLMATILAKEESERRAGFRAVETQLELADALIRQDMDEIRRLVRQTMQSMGVTDEQLRDIARQLKTLGGLDDVSAEELGRVLGFDVDVDSERDAGAEPPAESSPDRVPDQTGERSDEPSSRWPPPPTDDESSPAPDDDVAGGDGSASPDDEPPAAPV